MEKTKYVVLGHGSGGKLMHELIENVFVKHLYNEVLAREEDSAVLPFSSENLVFTTDSYVVDPVFFPGGNIGKLAVCGTVNDLAVMGATPKYFSVSFIIEEGFPIKDLEIIVKSMAEEATAAGVIIATGDTKVVKKGQCDKIFINTSGIGQLDARCLIKGEVESTDAILLNGYIADHGMAVMGARESLNLSEAIQSDCACLHHLLHQLMREVEVKFARDATRGGLATVLSELAQKRNVGVEIEEEAIPLREDTAGICEMLGFDPLHVANEGKVVLIVPRHQASKALNILRSHELGKDAAIVGEITATHLRKVVMHTSIGGKRMVQMLSGEQLPRIC